MRGMLVALILAATAALVVGVAIERSGEAGHHARSARVGGTATGEGAAAEHGDEESGGEESGGEELRPLGVDVEAWPFVVLAAVASVALAVAAWRNPRRGSMLWLVVVAMLAFMALDIREVVHQAGVAHAGLFALAATAALLHLAAAAVAGAMRAQRRSAMAPSPGTIDA